MTAVLERPEVGMYVVEQPNHDLRVRVEHRHIMAGVPGITGSCPIALALRDVGMIGMSVGPTVVRDSAGEIVAALPLAAREFVEAFDTQKPVQPFEFQLKL